MSICAGNANMLVGGRIDRAVTLGRIEMDESEDAR
jgi:hypothetical protein